MQACLCILQTVTKSPTKSPRHTISYTTLLPTCKQFGTDTVHIYIVINLKYACFYAMTDEDSIFYVHIANASRPTPYRFYINYKCICAQFSYIYIYIYTYVPIQTRAQLRLISHNKTI